MNTWFLLGAIWYLIGAVSYVYYITRRCDYTTKDVPVTLLYGLAGVCTLITAIICLIGDIENPTVLFKKNINYK